MTTSRVYLTTTGAHTYQVPAGVTSMKVDCIGAGEGSGIFGGAGGGAWGRHPALTVTPGATLNYFVGSGGSNGPGGNTWFGGTSWATASVGAQGGGQVAARTGGRASNRPNAAATSGADGGDAPSQPCGGAAGFHGPGISGDNIYGGSGDAGYGGAGSIGNGGDGNEYATGKGSGAGGGAGYRGGLYGGGSGYPNAGAQGLIVLEFEVNAGTYYFLTTVGAGQWPVPDGVFSIRVDTIGGGGSGWTSGDEDTEASLGGNGGNWSRIAAISVTPGTNISYSVGDGCWNAVDGNTWFNGATFSAASVGAEGGGNAMGTAGGPASARPNAANTTGYRGGAGIDGSGGGAAGPHGDGGSNGIGDAGYGGALSQGYGAPGGTGTEYDASHGSGGGGLGYTSNGGLYGGGGGAHHSAPSGDGAHGLIAIYVLAAVIIDNVAPSSGIPEGGTSVTITGTNFTGATSVKFGGTAATSVVVVNSTSITCVTPAHAAGAVAVEIVTPNGTGYLENAFSYGLNVPILLTRGPALF